MVPSSLLSVMVLVTGLLILGFLILIRRPRLSVNDSDLFREVLEHWRPIIAAKPFTPRSLKRFINSLRYFSMRQRDPQKALEALDAAVPFRNFFTGVPASVGNQNKPEAIGEPALVALATLFYVFPQRLRMAEHWPAIIRGDYLPLLEHLPESTATTLQQVLQVHLKKWNSPFTQANLQSIRLLSEQFH
jgi:hypothetical protein